MGQFIRRLGHREVILKSDQEPATLRVKQCLREPGLETNHEEAPIGECQSNGFAERAVQALEMQARVPKLSTDARLQARIPATHPLFSYMVAHAADLVNKYEVGRDGRTAWEEWRGKPYKG